MKKLNKPGLGIFLAILYSGCEKTPVPTADFTMDKSSALVEELITFTNTSKDASSYSWKFGDGGTSALENPTHRYSEAGTFTVELTAAGEGGTHSVSKSITVVYPEPVAGFTMSAANARVYDTIHFANTSTNATSYLWNFGDGPNSTLENPTHIYFGVGQFVITLTASNEGGSDIFTDVIEIGPPIPVAGFETSTDTAEIGEVIQFTNTSRGATGYIWDFGDGNTSTKDDPTHSYDQIGTYTVELTALGVEETDMYSKEMTVVFPVPVADFSMSKTSAEAGETIEFTNTSVHADTYLWDFGDGETSTEENPSHQYSDVGTYTITLTATGEGGTDTKSALIDITEPTVLGNWILAEGSYDGSGILNLTGYFNILNDTDYEAGFDIETDDGAVIGKYTIEGGVFDSNINGEFFFLQGQKTVSDPSGLIYKTDMHCSEEVFNTWGNVALGLNLPTVELVDTRLRITSADGKTVLWYDEE